LKAAATAAAAVSVPYFVTRRSGADDGSPGDRPLLGCIGTGDRWKAVGPNALKFADCVAVCDVDRSHVEEAQGIVNKAQGRTPEAHEDYRRVLDRKDIDVVTVVTPDHWHTKIAIEAMQAGKDVYCEKPLTLTIEEGKQICQVAQQTGRVFQVGTQQRSEMDQEFPDGTTAPKFLMAVALVRAGRIGEVRKVTCVIGGAPTSGPIPVVDPPSHLNWNLWLGQTPLVAYRFKEGGRWGNSRCHYEFRWWYEYSGGKLTDWGAHHVDIAQWALAQNGDGQGPTLIEPLMVKHPVTLERGLPTDDSQYNCATEFTIKCAFPGGIEMLIRENAPDLNYGNGIIFEGTKGELRVSRGKLEGPAVDALKDNPLPADVLTELSKDHTVGGPNAHMRNFFECVASRKEPISDVFTHHRALTTCHLANIAIRLGRALKWDPQAEQVLGDDEASAWQHREQRKGFEIKA
jgi:predicted dehydrogenase